ncbi:MAG: hypothetical protein GSR84_04275 [Desulfurococcales archaeon]|nr:hypothetical protein [Desulfurococcales archaeon]
MDGCCTELSGCVLRNTRIELERLIRRVRLENLLGDIRENTYKAHSWQLLKRTMATPIARCIRSLAGPCGIPCLDSIYFSDLTGGEHSYIEGHGGKDLDLILYTPCELDREKVEESLESCIESAVTLLLSEMLTDDPKKILGIPNIIEVHIVRDRRDLPYYNMVKYRSRTLTRLL